MPSNIRRMRASRRSSRSVMGRPGERLSFSITAGGRWATTGGPATLRATANRGRTMLTADGCRARRARVWDALRDRTDVPALVLADPLHLRYLANFYVDPFSLGADF